LVAGSEGVLGRFAGAEPSRWPSRWRVVTTTIVIVAILVVVWVLNGATGPAGVNPGVLTSWAAVVAGYLLAPVARWVWSLHLPRGVTPWPNGAEAYAVLSVLSCARRVYPDRLAVLVGMPRGRCDQWLQACSVHGLAIPATHGRFVTRRPEITAAGVARLAEWNSELAARAAGAQPWTDSTAPTTPDVSSDRSPSDVT
jgi:hypothetical protein